jgi:bacterioferritin
VAKKGQKVSEMLNTNIALEAAAMKMYKEAAMVCAAERGQISKELFEELLKDEEGHFNYFENVKDHIDKLGAAYLTTLVG